MYHNTLPNIDKEIEHNDKIALFKHISNTDISSLEILLRKLSPAIDLTQIVNLENGYTLLHLAVFKDSDQIIFML